MATMTTAVGREALDPDMDRSMAGTTMIWAMVAGPTKTIRRHKNTDQGPDHDRDLEGRLVEGVASLCRETEAADLLDRCREAAARTLRAVAGLPGLGAEAIPMEGGDDLVPLTELPPRTLPVSGLLSRRWLLLVLLGMEFANYAQ